MVAVLIISMLEWIVDVVCPGKKVKESNEDLD